MARSIYFKCDKCGQQIASSKGFISFSGTIVDKELIEGDYCISCLVEMCNESLMSPEVKQMVKDLKEERARRIDEERRAARDW